jgi:hypothetical protein
VIGELVDPAVLAHCTAVAVAVVDTTEAAAVALTKTGAAPMPEAAVVDLPILTPHSFPTSFTLKALGQVLDKSPSPIS